MINAGVNADNWLIKVYVIRDTWFIWNPSNCESECDQSFDTGEYSDHENCKCRKKLVDKLVTDFTENIDEVKIAEIASEELRSMELHSTGLH